jgi:hypothetical protein
MQQGKMFFVMGLCMALVQGGYVRRIPHGKEIIAAMSVCIINSRLISSAIFSCSGEGEMSLFLINDDSNEYMIEINGY